MDGNAIRRNNDRGGIKSLLDSYFFRRNMLGILFVLPALLFLVFFVLYPVLYNVFLSLTNATLSKDTFKFVGLKNYVKLFKSTNFLRYLKNNIIWTVFSVIGQLALGLAFALIITKRVRGGTFLRSILLVPYVVPAVSISLLTRWLCNSQYGIITLFLNKIGAVPNSYSPLSLPGYAMATVIIVNTWRSYPFPMLIYWAALKGIDQEIYEAAVVDGANKYQSFLYVTLPQLRNTTLTLAILRIAWTATYFDLIWMVTGGGPAGTTTHLPIMIYQNSFGTFQTGYAAAVSVVLGLMLIVFVIYYVRQSGNVETSY